MITNQQIRPEQTFGSGKFTNKFFKQNMKSETDPFIDMILCTLNNREFGTQYCELTVLVLRQFTHVVLILKIIKSL